MPTQATNNHYVRMQRTSTPCKHDKCVTWRNSIGGYHRIGGPAVEYPNGYVAWYLDDAVYSFDDYCKKVRPHLSDEEYFTLVLTYTK